ncbi:hypothetical protein RFI_09731 [Reticulomyxa filosa]|uniref:Kelch motif family protein n=1 Tax=Reticulomyxa filosa TaxID=46433 RepID=X6NN58_RETFI|nr:hypothetical protein RFI_09731 [Reticulomyxa filosa]|eukprot:ETO27401.1 hypothetical protein RFI_09731 [Reticulomyxa filosa]
MDHHRNEDNSLLNFEQLPDLPADFYRAQCVWFGEELLICGGSHNNQCYSYHVSKRQYKEICSYPKEVTLYGHTVIICARSESKEKDRVTLLSFGGGPYGWSVPYHTMLMDYKSVWSKQKSKHKNKWVAFGNGTFFGENYDFGGARALVGGTDNALLFITRSPRYIEIVDLKTYKYIDNLKNNILPISKDNDVFYHCFIPLSTHHFILISENEIILIQFHQSTHAFEYHILPTCPTLKFCRSFAYVYFNHQIILFGGWDFNKSQCTDSIHIFHVKKKSWSQCNFTLPFPINGSAAVFNPFQFAVHLIGGKNDDRENQSTHFFIPIKKIVWSYTTTI